MPFYDLICDNGHEQIDVMAPVGQKPVCPICGGTNQTLWRGKGRAVIQDSIEGGVWIKHGICNDDGTPKKYYSKTEIREAAKAKGLHNHVEHVTEKGTDKSPHTTRWF